MPLIRTRKLLRSHGACHFDQEAVMPRLWRTSKPLHAGFIAMTARTVIRVADGRFYSGKTIAQ